MPFLANWTPSRVYLNWLADRLQKTKTREEVEAGFWGKLVNVVMRRPLVFAIPIIIGMIALIIPLHNLSLAAGSAKSTCRRTTRYAWRRRTSTNSSPATARTS